MVDLSFVLNLIFVRRNIVTYVTDRKGHDRRYAIDSRKLQKKIGLEPSLQFEEGIEETVKWYLENQEWMDHVTSGEYQKYCEEMFKNSIFRNPTRPSLPLKKVFRIPPSPFSQRELHILTKPQ